jgi:hypothetical protein
MCLKVNQRRPALTALGFPSMFGAFWVTGIARCR